MSLRKVIDLDLAIHVNNYVCWCWKRSLIFSEINSLLDMATSLIQVYISTLHSSDSFKDVSFHVWFHVKFGIFNVKYYILIQIFYKKIRCLSFLELQKANLVEPCNSYRKVAISNTSQLEAHAGFFRLLIKGIYDLCTVTFWQKVDFLISNTC